MLDNSKTCYWSKKHTNKSLWILRENFIWMTRLHSWMMRGIRRTTWPSHHNWMRNEVIPDLAHTPHNTESEIKNTRIWRVRAKRSLQSSQGSQDHRLVESTNSWMNYYLKTLAKKLQILVANTGTAHTDTERPSAWLISPIFSRKSAPCPSREWPLEHVRNK